MFETFDRPVPTLVGAEETGTADPPVGVPPDGPAGSAADTQATTAQRVAVEDLDAAGALARARADRVTADRAEAELLAVAAHWADLHPVVYRPDGTPVTDPDGISVRGMEQLMPLAGDGTPAVAEFACAELAAVLGMTTVAGQYLVGEALELRHRLPRLWRRIHAGDLPAWRGRQVARETMTLSREAAGWVDDQLAPFAHKIGLVRIRTAVAAAILKFDPDRAAEEARKAQDRHGVWVGDVATDGTCDISITADAVDALSFEQTIAAVAAGLGRLGDDSDLQHRRAAAVGVLADPQTALDLLTDDGQNGTAASAGDATGSSVGSSTADPGRRLRRKRGAKVVVYAHLSVDALHGLRKHGDDCGCRCPGAQRAEGSSLGALGQSAGQSADQDAGEPAGVKVGPVARLEGLGPVTTEQIASWLGRDHLTAPQITIKPVLDLAESRPVDAYEAPEAMDEVIYLRRSSCIFPWCNNTSRRKDTEHPEGYDPDGPADQTQPDRLAHVCRRHHRLKTHGGWSYVICEPGIYLWRSPHGRRYLVDGTGTRSLADADDPGDVCGPTEHDAA